MKEYCIFCWKWIQNTELKLSCNDWWSVSLLSDQYSWLDWISILFGLSTRSSFWFLTNRILHTAFKRIIYYSFFQWDSWFRDRGRDQRSLQGREDIKSPLCPPVGNEKLLKFYSLFTRAVSVHFLRSIPLKTIIR